MKLSAQGRPSPALRSRVIGRVTLGDRRENRPDYVLALPIFPDPVDLDGYAGLVVSATVPAERVAASSAPIVHSLGGIDHLGDGDIVRLDPSGHVRTLFRSASCHNAILVTEQCNSYCLMCSQPPRDIDDSSFLAEHLRLIDLIEPPLPAELGLTGGEPTLFKDGLGAIIARCKQRLPGTALHILSNGRLFYYGAFARAVAEIGHPDLMIGIPIYSDIDSEHDYVVQCRGAFDETLIGIQNLCRYGVRVEVRVVVHRLTYGRLTETAEFIYRNLPVASHVALMGLEAMGLAIPNMNELWVDPWEYRDQLERATLFLASRGMTVSVYNHQLCTLPTTIWPWSRKSISDWKNEYLPLCDRCSLRDDCGGFFASSVRRGKYSAHLHPLEVRPPSDP